MKGILIQPYTKDRSGMYSRAGRGIKTSANFMDVMKQIPAGRASSNSAVKIRGKQGLISQNDHTNSQGYRNNSSIAFRDIDNLSLDSSDFDDSNIDGNEDIALKGAYNFNSADKKEGETKAEMKKRLKLEMLK